MANEAWYVKLWNAVKAVFEAVVNFFVCLVKKFFSIFNSWHKLATIALAVFTWDWLNLSVADKIGTFILFSVLALLVYDIAKDK